MYAVIATSHTRYINDTYVLGQVVLLLQQIHPMSECGMENRVLQRGDCGECCIQRSCMYNPVYGLYLLYFRCRIIYDQSFVGTLM